MTGSLSTFAKAITKTVSGRDRTVAETVANLTSRAFGLVADFFSTLPDGLAAIAHRPTEAPHCPAKSFLGASLR